MKVNDILNKTRNDLTMMSGLGRKKNDSISSIASNNYNSYW
jgi:hypothetical protein